MKKIFVSYSRDDLSKVKRIVEEIKSRTGLECWMDLSEIESGDRFDHVIIDAINEADVVLFMMSKHSISKIWTEKEVRFALNKDKRLVPISIDGTTISNCDWLAFHCQSLDCIDYSVTEQKEKLFSNLLNWTNAPVPGIPHRRNTQTKNRFKILGVVVVAILCIFAIAYFLIIKDYAPQKSVGQHYGHVWVDLGLSVKWASCNIGASDSISNGYYFAWGERNPKGNFNWKNYFDTKDNGRSFLTFNFLTNSVSILPTKEHDAAQFFWGGNWRLPTKMELLELKDSCRWERIDRDNTHGYKVTGPNGNFIFLPASGYRYATELSHLNDYGEYWSSELQNDTCAWRLVFTKVDLPWVSRLERRFGRSIRPVLKED